MPSLILAPCPYRFLFQFHPDVDVAFAVDVGFCYRKLLNFTLMPLPLQSRKEEWRRRLAHLEKTHSRQFKKTRAGLKKPTETLAKLEKKLKKNKGDAEMAKMRETLVNELKVIFLQFFVSQTSLTDEEEDV